MARCAGRLPEPGALVQPEPAGIRLRWVCRRHQRQPAVAGVNPATGLGTAIGVIGGYEQGGYSADVSYAARFGASAAALYKIAVSRS
jgi:hypothetical protein